MEMSNGAIKLSRPASGVFTSGFGPRWGRQHRGIDIASNIGTPIYAVAAGVVIEANHEERCATTGYINNPCGGGFGNRIYIRHCNGWITRYAHLKLGGIKVREGQRVERGQLIGEMGSSGSSTGPHLHFEVRVNNGATAQNPQNHLEKPYAFQQNNSRT